MTLMRQSVVVLVLSAYLLLAASMGASLAVTAPPTPTVTAPPIPSVTASLDPTPSHPSTPVVDSDASIRVREGLLRDFATSLTVLALAFAAFQGYLGYRSGRRADVALLHDQIERWRQLGSHWSRAVLVGRGPNAFYLTSSTEDVRAYVETIKRYRTLVNDSNDSDDWYEEYKASYRDIAEYKGAAQAVLKFLSAVGFLIVDGKLSPRLAYATLGTEVLRHGAALRQLIDQPPPDPTNPFIPQAGPPKELELGDEVRSWVQEWLTYHPGTGRRTLILLDVLWAEAAHLRDLSIGELQWAAAAKEAFGTGRRNRSRLSQECRRLGHPILAIRLSRRLRFSEYRSTFILGKGVQRPTEPIILQH